MTSIHGIGEIAFELQAMLAVAVIVWTCLLVTYLLYAQNRDLKVWLGALTTSFRRYLREEAERRKDADVGKRAEREILRP